MPLVLLIAVVGIVAGVAIVQLLIVALFRGVRLLAILVDVERASEEEEGDEADDE